MYNIVVIFLLAVVSILCLHSIATHERKEYHYICKVGDTVTLDVAMHSPKVTILSNGVKLDNNIIIRYDQDPLEECKVY